MTVLESSAFGSTLQDLVEDVFKQLIQYLLKNPDLHAIQVALDLFHNYYIQSQNPQRKLPEELALSILTHESLFRAITPGTQSQVMGDYYWTEIGKAFLQLYPFRGVEIAYKMLEHFGEAGPIGTMYRGPSLTILAEIARQYPIEIWKRVSEYLGPPIDTRAFYIREWLRGIGLSFDDHDQVQGALYFFPSEKIWEWVNTDVEGRAWYVASFVPKALFREKDTVCLAREILVRYGNREDVRTNLMANFSTEGWTGPASLHGQKKRQKLLDFRKEEDNERVKQWIDEYVDALDRQIERARIEEERRGF